MRDEAKRCVEALRFKEYFECINCPIPAGSCKENCLFDVAADLIESLAAELEQVEQERDGLNILLGQAQSMLDTRTRERDAAVEDLKRAEYWTCEHCKFNLIPAPCGESNMDCGSCKFENCICRDCIENSRWQWRGVQEERQ